jgi:ParB/RepB/Spo0J family partition protein
MISKLQYISLDRIKDPERPMRTDLTPESVDELVFSIKEVGIIQPLVVCASGDNYEVIAGHRRLLAASIAGLTEAPCIIKDEKGLDREVLKMHENIAREDINPIDWAIHLNFLKEKYKLTNAKLAEMTHFSEAWISQHLEITTYPPEVLDAIKSGSLAFTSARELAQIKDATTRKIYVDSAVTSGVTPAMAANWRRQANAPTYQEVHGNDGDVSQNVGDLPKIALPICPVCNADIKPEDQLYLTIHKLCAPQAQGNN